MVKDPLGKKTGPDHWQLHDAGKEYCRLLGDLGFRPAIMCWSFWTERDTMELSIVDSWFDRVGPTVIYDLLFMAYDASVTPKTIDPLLVTLYSPRSEFGVDLANALRNSFGVDQLPDGRQIDLSQLVVSVGTVRPVLVRGMDIFAFRNEGRNALEDRKRWDRFRRSVEQQIAA